MSDLPILLDEKLQNGRSYSLIFFRPQDRNIWICREYSSMGQKIKEHNEYQWYDRNIVDHRLVQPREWIYAPSPPLYSVQLIGGFLAEN